MQDTLTGTFDSWTDIAVQFKPAFAASGKDEIQSALMGLRGEKDSFRRDQAEDLRTRSRPPRFPYGRGRRTATATRLPAQPGDERFHRSQPSLARINELIETREQSGLRITTDISGISSSGSFQSSVDLSAFRILQEALTNVQISALENAPAVIVLTTFNRDDYLFDALRAGAAAFPLKNSPTERIVDATQSRIKSNSSNAEELNLLTDRGRTNMAQFYRTSP
jgi:hypothetical protein